MNPSSTTTSNIPADQIAKRAYQIYVNAGSPDGHDLEHWIEAEAQLTAEKQNPAMQSRILAAIRNSA